MLKHDQLAREDDKGWSLKIQDENVPLYHCCLMIGFIGKGFS